MITDLVFPEPESGAVAGYADGSAAWLVLLRAWTLGSEWEDRDAAHG